ncbi:AraC family transcriptional regulator [Enhygromyxa salina]|uniref:HTH-type transcriptional regulator VirS n=1 Tax=Enhygromyxa salina TaxID=215803 RepID=A0A2S9YST5_9BACT|nr:AraC family transcriptional regulator [Enhygromyxa salina]PRQ08153.1 HTH-type transcriptional regulator VirS [Enhygromyxa salina]
MASSTITASWTRRVLTHARERGLDATDLALELGIAGSELAAPHGRVCFAAHQHLLDHLARRLDDPGLGLAIGTGAAAADFGMIGLLAESCDTLGQALAMIRRFNAVANEASFMTFWVEGGRLIVQDAHHRDGRPMSPTVAEATLAFYLAVVRRTTGIAQPLVEVWLAHAAHRGWTAERAETFGVPRRFGRPIHALVFPAELIRAPLLTARPELASNLEPVVHHMHDALAPLDSPVARVAQQVRVDLARGGPVSLRRFARRAGISPRTLQRQLTDADHSYRELVDRTRRDAAYRLLTTSTVTLDAVAETLGYADIRAFRRACVRWFGVPPSQLRLREGGAAC